MKSEVAGQSARESLARADGSEVAVKTGGHWLLKILQSLDVDYIFGTTGAGMPDIQDAMVVVKPPKWIQGLHEFVSICAATGYGLASGKVGVAMIDRIVGTLNAAGAFYAGFHTFPPVAVLASSNVAGVALPPPGMEYHYHSNQVHPVTPWTKWWTQVESLETLPQDIEKALFLALSEPRSFTYVSLRQDLMVQELKKGRMPKAGTRSSAPRVPDDGTLRKIVEEILSSSNPGLMTTRLGRNPSSVGSLVNFAHTFGIAVGEARFFMNYPLTDPLHIGYVDCEHSPNLLPSTDLIIALEIGLLPPWGFKEGVPVIDISSDPLHRQDVVANGDYGNSQCPAIIRAEADSGPTLERLVELGQSRITPSDRRRIKERIARLAEVHQKVMKEWRTKAEETVRSGVLDGWSVGHILHRHWTKDMILIDGTQSQQDALMRSSEISTPGSFFSNPSSHLGFSTGMAYGVALADTRYIDVRDMKSYKVGRISKSSKTVVCILGDGEAIIGNLPSALWTCKHYGIGVLYVVLNNACWGVEWGPIARSPSHWSRDAGDFEALDIDSPRFDFVHIAEASNVDARRISTVEELDSALPESLKKVQAGEPVLFDVVMQKHTGAKTSVVP